MLYEDSLYSSPCYNTFISVLCISPRGLLPGLIKPDYLPPNRRMVIFLVSFRRLLNTFWLVSLRLPFRVCCISQQLARPGQIVASAA